MKIKILITGGTIDNLDAKPGKNASRNQKTIIPELLGQSRITAIYSIENVLFKDTKTPGTKTLISGVFELLTFIFTVRRPYGRSRPVRP